MTWSLKTHQERIDARRATTRTILNLSKNLLHVCDGASRFDADADDVRLTLYRRSRDRVKKHHIQQWLLALRDARLVDFCTGSGKAFGCVLNYGQRDTPRKVIHPSPDDEAELPLAQDAPPKAKRKKPPPPQTPPTESNRSEGDGSTHLSNNEWVAIWEVAMPACAAAAMHVASLPNNCIQNLLPACENRRHNETSNQHYRAVLFAPIHDRVSERDIEGYLQLPAVHEHGDIKLHTVSGGQIGKPVKRPAARQKNLSTAPPRLSLSSSSKKERRKCVALMRQRTNTTHDLRSNCQAIGTLRAGFSQPSVLRRVINAGKDCANHRESELLHAAVYPLQVSRRRLADVTRYRDQCAKAGLLRLWTAANGRPYVQIPDDPDYTGQRRFKIPEPPPKAATRRRPRVSMELNGIEESVSSRAWRGAHDTQLAELCFSRSSTRTAERSCAFGGYGSFPRVPVEVTRAALLFIAD